MSVNNEVFIGDCFKFRIQVLPLVTDVVSVIGGGMEWRIGQRKADILRQFPYIVSSEDKHQVFSLESNCKHNCRLVAPPTNFQCQG